jgi:hypothetical protein
MSHLVCVLLLLHGSRVCVQLAPPYFYFLSSAANRQMAGLAIEWFYPRGYIMLPAFAN